jgi:Protein of unknown function (DUF3455)
MKRMLVLVSGLLLIAWSGLTAGEDKIVPVKIPEKLQVPERHRVLLTVEAEGVQIYVSKEGKDGKPEWSFKAPLADLSDRGKKIGYHYAGPSWEALDGSKVVRDKSVEVASVKSPSPGEDVPWLRIKVKPDGEQGTMLSKAVYVLRVNTHGGVPPTEPPARVGTEVGVKYRATYQFHGPDK